MAIGSLAGAPCAGVVYEVMKIYDVSLHIGGGFLVFSSFLMLVPRVFNRFCSEEEYEDNDIYYDESKVDFLPTEIEILG